MPIVQESSAGRKYLKKVPTMADYGAITSSHLYSSQLGIDGAGNTVFTLPRDYAVGSNTLMIFVNGTKAIMKEVPSTVNEYLELTSKTVQFGASLSDTDIVEFYVAGTWLTTSIGGGGSGTLNSVYVNSNYTLEIMDRALVDSRVSAFVVTLPANPIQGDVVEIIDAGGNAETNNITIGRNAKPLQGTQDNLIVNSNGVRIFFVYVDDVYGWKFTLTANEIGQVTGFRQYHYVEAIESQYIFQLPFNVNMGTKNVVVYIDGVKQIQDIAYTIPNPTTIQLSEPLNGGEGVEFNSFNASSMGDLTFNTRSFEGIASDGQSIISLPFEYVVGAKNLTVYVNGTRVLPSLVSEIDSTTIELTSIMALNDTFLVESVEVGSFGIVPLAEDSNKLGNIIADDYIKTIDDATEFFVSLSGDDLNGDGSEVNPWRSVNKILEYARTHYKKGTSALIVKFDDGEYTIDEPFNVDNLLPVIQLEGKNAYDTTFIVYSNTSLGNDLYSLVVSVASTDNIAVNDYALINISSGNWSDWVKGAHKITAIDTINKRVTLEVWSPNCTPLNMATAITSSVSGDIKIIKAIFKNNVMDTWPFLTVHGGQINFKNLLLDGNNSDYPTAMAHKANMFFEGYTVGLINCNNVSVHSRHNSFVECSNIVVCNSHGVSCWREGTLLFVNGYIKARLENNALYASTGTLICDNSIVWGGFRGVFATYQSKCKAAYIKLYGIQSEGLYASTSKIDAPYGEQYYTIGNSLRSVYSSSVLFNGSKISNCGSEIGVAFWDSFVQAYPITILNVPSYTFSPAINTEGNGNSFCSVSLA